MSDPRFKRDDIVIESGVFYLVLAHGPRSFDVIEENGGTRFRCERPGMRLVVDDDFPGQEPGGTDPAYRARVTEMLRKNAAEAREERRTPNKGWRRNRGHVTNYPRRTR